MQRTLKSTYSEMVQLLLHIKGLLQKNYKLIFWNAAFLLACNFYLIANDLCNGWDAIWYAHYYKAGALEISSGRWLLPVLDKIRLGCGNIVIISVMYAVIIACSYVFALETFQIEKGFFGGFIGCCLFSAAPVVCSTLSFQYTAVGYGLAMFFAVFTGWLIAKAAERKQGKVLHLLLAVFSMVASLALYQAYIGVTASLMYLLLLKHIHQGDFKRAGGILLHGFPVAAFGGVLYALSIRLSGRLFSTAASGWHSLNNMGGALASADLLTNIKNCYAGFLKNTLYMGSLYRYGKTVMLLLAVVGLMILADSLRRKHYGICALEAVMLAALPIVCCIVSLVIPSADMLVRMSAPIVFSVSMLYYLVYYVIRKNRWVIVALAVTVCYVSVNMVGNDQLAMFEGQNAVTNIDQAIINTLISDGYDPSNTQMLIVGSPHESGMFHKSIVWENANLYARFGIEFDNGSIQATYDATARKMLGTSFWLTDASFFQSIKDTEDFQTMTNYPAEGSIRMFDDVLVIKVSDYYEK